MTVRLALFRDDQGQLKEVQPTSLASERQLEDWLSQDLSLLDMELALIGRQVTTSFGGRIDMLAIDPAGNLVVIELKRDKTPRDIVAQTLDYASWVSTLTKTQIDGLSQEYSRKPLAQVFSEVFEDSLPETVNTMHSMVIVASEIDDSTERIVEYLSSTHGLSINVVFFTSFVSKEPEHRFIGRAWLREVGPPDGPGQKEWSGFYYVNVGEGPHRNWDDNVKYGYIGAGQGTRWSRALRRLKVGDRIFAYLKSMGYVGFGEVVSPAVPISEYRPFAGDTPLLQLEIQAERAHENKDDSELCEWAAGVNWVTHYSREHAKTFKGIFAHPSVVCRLRLGDTYDFLVKEFAVEI